MNNNNTTTHGRKTSGTRRFGGRGGVTLVELLVAGVIVVVFIGGLVALLRYMRAEQQSDEHRRQARAAINRIMEGAFTNYTEWPGTYEIKHSLIDPRITSAATATIFIPNNDNAPGILDGDFPQVCLNCDVNGNVVGGIKDTAFLNIVAKREDVTLSGKDIKTHVFNVRLTWIEAGGNTESIELVKRLAPKVWD